MPLSVFMPFHFCLFIFKGGKTSSQTETNTQNTIKYVDFHDNRIHKILQEPKNKEFKNVENALICLALAHNVIAEKKGKDLDQFVYNVYIYIYIIY